MKKLNRTLSLSRRHVLTAFLSLSTFLVMKRGKETSQDKGETVIAGGWVLKKSDLS